MAAPARFQVESVLPDLGALVILGAMGCVEPDSTICCTEPDGELSCRDGRDNDCDGLIDQADLDCAGPAN